MRGDERREEEEGEEVMGKKYGFGLTKTTIKKKKKGLYFDFLIKKKKEKYFFWVSYNVFHSPSFPMLLPSQIRSPIPTICFLNSLTFSLTVVTAAAAAAAATAAAAPFAPPPPPL